VGNGVPRNTGDDPTTTSDGVMIPSPFASL